MKRTSLPLLVRAEWDRILAAFLLAGGAVLVIVAWAGVSGTPFVADQLAYLASGGIGGLFLLALGLALLMSADHHDEWRKLDAIEAALRETGRVADTPASPSRPADASRVAEGRKRGLSVLTLGGTVSAVILLVGWVHASGSGRRGVAAEGLTMSIAGLLVAVAAATAFLMPSRSRLTTRRALLLRPFALADGLALPGVAGGPAGRPPTNGSSGDVVLVADGLTRYHRSGCPAVKGLVTQSVSRTAVGSEIEQCDLCRWGEQR